MLLDFVKCVLICNIPQTKFICAVKGDKHVIWRDDGMEEARQSEKQVSIIWV